MEEEKPLVSFALIGDVQYADREPVAGRDFQGALDLLERTIDGLNRLKLDFIVSLGDLGDGQQKQEIPAVLRAYEKSEIPVRYVAGNHDFVLNTEEELQHLFGLKSLFYDFAAGGVRFIVLNGLDVSRFSPPGSERHARYLRFREEHQFRKLRDWDGMLSAESKAWLRAKLAMAEKNGENAVIITHVPLCREATGGNAVAFDSAEMLELLDGFPGVRAVFAGHYHEGGEAPRNGVLHKTVRAICSSRIPTASICRIYPDRLTLEGLGEEQNAEILFDWHPVTLAGRAFPGSWITSDTGELVRADENGAFSLTVPIPGVYTLKAMADGFSDAFLRQVSAPAEGLQFGQVPDPGRRVIHGRTGGFSLLKIRENGRPVRSFDLNGNAFGALERPDLWCEHSENFWSRGEYAFSAQGEVSIQEEPYFPELRKRGWFKGDFHAHVIHGENIYCGNLPLFAFAARAEHYDWLYCAENYENTTRKGDPFRAAKHLAAPDFLLKLNREFPKNTNGHIGNLGLMPEYGNFPCDPEKITNFELVKEYVTSRGGVAVPVHPLYDDGRKVDGVATMTGKETELWLHCEPELCPCLDLFYFDNDPDALPYWMKLLDRGYRIGVTATSDAAFDVGRTPGSGRGATFVKMAALTEPELLSGIRSRRTVVTWNGAVVLLSVDGETSGGILAPRGTHAVLCEVFYRPGKPVTLKLFHNGKTEETFDAVIPAGGYLQFRTEMRESGNGYVLAVLEDRTAPGRIRSAASPVYFRTPDFQEPGGSDFPRPFPEELRRRLRYSSRKDLLALKLF